MTSSQVFEGIAAVSQLGMAVAIGIGVLVAYRQLSTGRVERLALRKAEMAEELVGIVHKVIQEFDQIRTPGELIVPENSDDQQVYVQARIERLYGLNPTFQRLGELTIRQRLLMGSPDIEAKIKELEQIRNEIFMALMKVRRMTGPTKASISQSRYDSFLAAQDLMYGAGDESDSIHIRQTEIIATVEATLKSVANLGLKA